MNESLTLNEAKKLALLSQKLLSEQQTIDPLDATLLAIEHLGYVQIDTISVIERAHHHTLWNRNNYYETSHLDTLIKERKVYEYWSHAAAFLPMSEYRYSLIRKYEMRENKQKYWYERDPSLMDFVLKRIESEGPLMAKDFENNKKKNKEWSSSKEKQALERLFMEGELMISSRKNFHKVYDLTENVLPKEVNTTEPTTEEYIRFLIIKYLTVNGLGNASEISYLLKNVKTKVTKTLKEMALAKELITIEIEGANYYALTESLDLLNKAIDSNRVKILSPFDNSIIQRKRTNFLFNFDYKLECYTPKAKRKYGYFVLPILWNEKLVARMDCKVDRKESVLYIYNIFLEEEPLEIEAFATAFYKELLQFLKFNNCHSFVIETTTPKTFKTILETLK